MNIFDNKNYSTWDCSIWSGNDVSRFWNKYCDMHAVGQQSTVETLTTVAMATDKHATMEATSVFYVV
jgi:hypothetical protein